MNFAKYRVQLSTEKKYSSKYEYKYEYEYSIPEIVTLQGDGNQPLGIFRFSTKF